MPCRHCWHVSRLVVIYFMLERCNLFTLACYPAFFRVRESTTPLPCLPVDACGALCSQPQTPLSGATNLAYMQTLAVCVGVLCAQLISGHRPTTALPDSSCSQHGAGSSQSDT
jgi:hypothetical protein